MNIVLKRVLIAAALVAVGAVILAATKLYGVWVITGIAAVLFILGLLRKDNAPGKGGDIPGDTDRHPEKGENQRS
ncbi:MAG: hypothetical protein IH628_10165 [Proteobacteria bacterium]|nr:hypothetical protein [Pseudomonadota bacterium]